MADRVAKVTYVHVKVPHRARQGAAVLAALREAGVGLVAYSGFPAGGGTAQLDLVPKSLAALRSVARRRGFRLSVAKKGFLISGTDRVGAVHHHIDRLARAGINVTAADAVAAGQGRYGMILWVKPKDYAKAARALGAK